jgi:UDP:flavonoid glycosyltransferase YjiC (YdhE family)
VTGESLGALLVKVLADQSIAESVAQMEARLAAEDGTLNAHKAIEKAIASFPYPWPTAKSGGEV